MIRDALYGRACAAESEVIIPNIAQISRKFRAGYRKIFGDHAPG
jgi:hypothetical protein